MLRREACNGASYANLAERKLNYVAAFAGHVSGSLCLTLVTVSISPGVVHSSTKQSRRSWDVPTNGSTTFATVIEWDNKQSVVITLIKSLP